MSDTPSTRYQNPVDWTREQLLTQIQNGEYGPDAFLPPERQLAIELGVARSSVRQALTDLANQGLVERTRGRGTRVLRKAEIGATFKVALVNVVTATGTGEGPLIMEGTAARLRKLDIAYDRIPLCHPNAWDAYKGIPGARKYTDIPGMEDGYDGLIFFEMSNPVSEEYGLRLAAAKYPVVVANLENDLPVAATRVNHGAVFKQAAELLMSFGHRRVAFLGRGQDQFYYPNALKGIREGLAQGGVSLERDFLERLDLHDSTAAYLATRDLLRLPDPPTGIVVGRDYFARGVYEAIEEAGLQVGYDVSVIGYDDLSWHVDDVEKTLTTFREPCAALGVAAADMLADFLTRGEYEPRQQYIDAPLVLRRSVGLVPQRASTQA